MLRRYQIKAARELLGWSKKDCAQHAGVDESTVRRLEIDVGSPKKRSLDAVVSALEAAGIRSGERGKIILEPPTGGILPASHKRIAHKPL